MDDDAQDALAELLSALRRQHGLLRWAADDEVWPIEQEQIQHVVEGLIEVVGRCLALLEYALRETDVVERPLTSRRMKKAAMKSGVLMDRFPAIYDRIEEGYKEP